ncbi:MAG: 16S rRNA (uracil(1498)-N(3))-methyltransferase [uncultured Nocardioidaceae bacterium]|uniref:Ribosomal RNA small subunit methyltransferase E n=1 Tax=uncultured Nocardioidaceae bacterium TaxID=253824 RepID=A0A6J4LU35_9ACTN|nr:MAG: 16S rRNA (uracil(1498)-N(3))-methyltransferase [uncultured Nocardioidaceae bacterium]
MSLPVFVLPTVATSAAGDTVVLDGDEGRHAAVVRRTRVGEQVGLTDGAGTLARCAVTAVSGGTVTAEVLDVSTRPPELPKVVVVQAIPKGERGELAVEVLTEVGVDVIVPWAASRSVARWRGERADKSVAKWRTAAHEAAKQARRVWFPTVAEPATTEDVVALLAGASVRVVLHEAASGPLADVPVPGRGEIVVVVGPEGGISDEELAAFGAVGAEPLRMGSSVLRSSTAGVAAVAALLARTPRWR